MNLTVLLNTFAAPNAFGSSNVLSFDGSVASVHVPPNAEARLRRIQAAGRKLAAFGCPSAELSGAGWDVEAQWAFAQGFSSAKRLGGVTFCGHDRAGLQTRWNILSWLKDVTNGTPEDISPATLADSAANLLTGLAPSAVTVERISGDALAEKGYVGLHAVGRGSVRGPVLLKLDYNPSGNPDQPYSAALVGKGITFDSGGYSIKETTSMLGMKCDMGGAATVTAALALAIIGGLKARVQLILCCAENLISGNAYKLGDILRYRNGVTVEIVNTDAEGRLVLADGLIDAAQTGAPWIFDAATLTGAAITALGTDYNAIFTPDSEVARQYLAWAQAENEPHWQLPLETFHRGKCPSAYADTANSRPIKGGGSGGASNAAGFLSRFVPSDRRWVHLDLSAAFADNDGALWGAGATGVGIRTLARALNTL